MPLYSYKGFDVASGAIRRGKIEADSVKSARLKLKQRLKVIVSDLKEEAPQDTAKKKSNILTGKVKLTEVAVMTRQFATLQAAHVPLDDSLRALTGQVESPILRNTLAAVKDEVSEGHALADAMRNYPGVFNRLYVNMVRAGESSGNLGIVLERLADFIEYQVTMRGQFISAVSYPAIMILASSGIIAFLFVSIVPKLQKVFASLKVTLPWYTQSLIGVSEFLQANWLWLIIFGILAAFLVNRWVATENGRKKFDHTILRLPLFGEVILRTNISRFTRTLSTLLSSGVPIIQALDITKNVISSTVIAEVLEDAKIAVQEGESLGITLDRSGRFPALVVHMVKTGEQTGELEQMLAHVANAYEAEVQRKISTMISLLEPLMIILMGGITVIVVAALMLPMLSVMNQIR